MKNNRLFSMIGFVIVFVNIFAACTQAETTRTDFALSRNRLHMGCPNRHTYLH